eukprot:1159572-Pelagomonas_calceolata.AAC.9
MPQGKAILGAQFPMGMHQMNPVRSILDSVYAASRRVKAWSCVDLDPRSDNACFVEEVYS